MRSVGDLSMTQMSHSKHARDGQIKMDSFETCVQLGLGYIIAKSQDLIFIGDLWLRTMWLGRSFCRFPLQSVAPNF
jgi:hypothetical protein